VDDDELLQELLTIFKDSSAGDMESLKQAVANDDATAARSFSHSIKGAAASALALSRFEMWPWS
jgi:HPt (histidine-containing phosphotransfer) domain-containing protein